MPENPNEKLESGKLNSVNAELIEFGLKLDEFEKNKKLDPHVAMGTIMDWTREIFANYPGKWFEGNVKDFYKLVVRAGILGANLGDSKGATEYVRSCSKILFEKHYDKKDPKRDRALGTLLERAKDKYGLPFMVDFKWLGETAITALGLNLIGAERLGKTADEAQYYDFFKKIDSLAVGVLKYAPSGVEQEEPYAKHKVLAAFAAYFYRGLLQNTDIADELKDKALAYNQKLVEGIPGLNVEKRGFLAQETGAQLEKKAVKRKISPEEKEKREANLQAKLLKELLETGPEVAKAQLSKISLLGDLSVMVLHPAKRGNVLFDLDVIKKNLVAHYKAKNYDGKTPFDLEKSIEEESGRDRYFSDLFSEAKKAAVSPKNYDVPYIDMLRILADNREAMSTDQLAKAGFAIAHIERQKGDYMSARGLMAKLLHRHIETAKGKLSEEEKEDCRKKSEEETSKHMRELLSDGKIKRNFTESFKDGFRKDKNREPTQQEISAGYERYTVALFNAQFEISSDMNLAGASLSKKYIDTANMTPLELKVYREFYDSVNPDKTNTLSDEGVRTYKNIGNFLAEMAIMGAAAVATGGISAIAGKVGKMAMNIGRIAKAIDKAKVLPSAVKYIARATFAAGKVVGQAYTFHEVRTILGNTLLGKEDKTIARVFQEGGTAEAFAELAPEIAMFGVARIGHGLINYFRMSKEARALAVFARANPEHTRLVGRIFEAAGSKTPKEAIARLKQFLADASVPDAVKSNIRTAIEDVEALGRKYALRVERIADPAARKIGIFLLRDFQFDALAMLSGEKTKETIDSFYGRTSEQGDTALADQILHAYIGAAVFGGAFRLGGRLVGRLTLSKEDISYITSKVPVEMRGRVEVALKGSNMAKEGLKFETPEAVPSERDTGKGPTALDKLRGTPQWKRTLVEIAAAVSAVFSGGKAEAKVEFSERTPMVEKFSPEKLPPLKDLSLNPKNVVLSPENGGKIGEADVGFSKRIFSVSQESLLTEMRAKNANPELVDAISTASNSIPVEFRPFVRFVPYFSENGTPTFYLTIDSQGVAEFTKNHDKIVMKLVRDSGVDLGELNRAGLTQDIIATYCLLWLLSKIPIVGIAIKPLLSLYTGGLKYLWNKAKPQLKKGKNWTLGTSDANETAPEFPALDSILDELGDLKSELSPASRESLADYYNDLMKILKAGKYNDFDKAKNLFKNIIKGRALDLINDDIADSITGKRNKAREDETTMKEKITLDNEIINLEKKVERIKALKWRIVEGAFNNRTNVSGVDFSSIETSIETRLASIDIPESDKDEIRKSMKDLFDSFKQNDSRVIEEVWLLLFEPLYKRSEGIAGNGKIAPDKIADPNGYEVYVAAKKFFDSYRLAQHNFIAKAGSSTSPLRKAMNLPNRIRNPYARRAVSFAIRLALVIGLTVAVDRAAPYVVETGVKWVGKGILKLLLPDAYDFFIGDDDDKKDGKKNDGKETPSKKDGEKKTEKKTRTAPKIR